MLFKPATVVTFKTRCVRRRYQSWRVCTHTRTDTSARVEWDENDSGPGRKQGVCFRPRPKLISAQAGNHRAHSDLPPPWAGIISAWAGKFGTSDSVFGLAPPWAEIVFGLGRNPPTSRIRFRPGAPLGRDRFRPGPKTHPLFSPWAGIVFALGPVPPGAESFSPWAGIVFTLGNVGQIHPSEFIPWIHSPKSHDHRSSMLMGTFSQVPRSLRRSPFT